MRIAVAVVTGFVAWTAVFLASNAIVAQIAPDQFAEDGSTSNRTILAVILVLSVVASLLAGWITAKIAKVRDNRPSWILGAVLLAVGIPVQVSSWNLLPLWYNLLFLLFLIPAAILGGGLAANKS